MNNIDKIAKIIKKTMSYQEATKPTLAIVYDSIIEVYPKLRTKNKEQYDCYRKIIIEQITNYYDSNTIDEKKSIKIILDRLIKVCLSL